jgi:hypothetical protein
MDGGFLAGWYAHQLRALQEPSLLEKPAAGVESIYRFTWLRSFDHPIAARVVVHGDGIGTLAARMADGRGGYGPGKLVTSTTRGIGPKEVRHILSLIVSMDFWKMPTEPAPYGTGCDGSEWILEASRRGEYHVVDRWSPDTGPLRELGLYMVRTLGKIDVPSNRIY